MRERDNDNRGGEVRRDDGRAPADDANTMPFEITDVKMQLDRLIFLLCVLLPPPLFFTLISTDNFLFINGSSPFSMAP